MPMPWKGAVPVPATRRPDRISVTPGQNEQLPFRQGGRLDQSRFIPNTNPRLTPDPILQTAFGFCSSKVLLTAVEFGVFTQLANERMTGTELSRALNLHSRAIGEFFDALVAMRFLEREGDRPNARYANTPATAL